MARVLLHHGLGNHRPPTHWLYRTAVALRQLGHQVSYVQFPNPDAPSLDEWQQVLVTELDLLNQLGSRAGELIFIGHSLGALNFIQGAKTEALSTNFDRALLVAPADPELLLDYPVGELASELPILAPAIHKAAGRLTVVASDKDVWLPRGVEATFGQPLGLQPIIVEGGKHFSDKDGWGPWQGVIDWVLDPAADLTKR